jgi:hypothetical protein
MIRLGILVGREKPDGGKNHNKINGSIMAERVGFEPTIPLQVCRISSAVHSTTLPPLRGLVGACSARAFS